MNLIHLDKIDSTNNYAKNILEKTSFSDFFKLDKTIIYADEQTNGRGRLNREFFSPKNTGLYFSLIYIPKEKICDPAIITTTACVAVCKQLENFYNNSIECKIKWVNDIYLNNKKICGILTEGVFDSNSQKIGAFVIGIGINICTENYPDELKHKAGSISKDTLSEFDKQKLIKNISQNIFDYYDTIDKAEIFQEYKMRSFIINKKVTIHPIINSEDNYKAKVLDITDNAKLKILLDTGEIKTLDSGEISLQNIE